MPRPWWAGRTNRKETAVASADEIRAGLASILEEVAEAVVDSMAGLQQHMREHPDFAEVGEAMLREWNEGLSHTCKLDATRAVLLPGINCRNE